MSMNRIVCKVSILIRHSALVAAALTSLLFVSAELSEDVHAETKAKKQTAAQTPAESNAAAQLNTFVARVSSARGDFVQFTVGPQGLTKPKQTGEFMFERPGRFSWRVLKPYEQRVVSDGTTLFQYDPDLNQVMTRPVGQAIGTSPAALLFGSGKIDQSFSLQVLPDQEGLSWLRALPKAADAGFVHVDIGFAQNLPVRFVLLDGFGQTTHVEMTNLQANPKLPADSFKFVTPVGVDVVKAQ